MARVSIFTIHLRPEPYHYYRLHERLCVVNDRALILAMGLAGYFAA